MLLQECLEPSGSLHSNFIIHSLTISISAYITLIVIADSQHPSATIHVQLMEGFP